ncbi:MAG: ATP-grasp domain-containing protein [Planctomycetota bacterium]|nr:ATP-grasp domain-containing protein [Planctomycetota bacterium]
MPPPSIIIVGASARAAAASAIRAGLAPWCVDLFADRDLRAIAPALRCPMHGYPDAIADLLHDAPHAPVLLTGAMENHPDTVAAIAQLRPILGSPPSAIRAARDPRILTSLPVCPGLRQCAVRFDRDDNGTADAAMAWLRKPLRSAAGRGIHVERHIPGNARHNAAPPEANASPPGFYLQQFIPGSPVGAVFTASHNGLRLVGLSRQIIGDPALGAHGFQYAGSIGPISLTPRQREALTHLGASLVARAGLRGLFGVDLILDPAGDLSPIEVNPRYPASVEVLEAAGTAPVLADLDEFREFASALPAPPTPTSSPVPIHGKAIAYARHDTIVPDLYSIFAADQIADVPDPDEPTPAGRPICTLLASGPSEADCLGRLHALAERLYTRLPS